MAKIVIIENRISSVALAWHMLLSRRIKVILQPLGTRNRCACLCSKGSNIVRPSCVGCGVCSAVCPPRVLKLENGQDKHRFRNEGSIVLGIIDLN